MERGRFSVAPDKQKHSEEVPVATGPFTPTRVGTTSRLSRRLAFFNVFPFLFTELRVGPKRMIKVQPGDEPEKTHKAYDHKGVAPSNLIGNDSDQGRSDDSTDARSAIKDGDPKPALIRQEPLRRSLAGSRLVETLAGAQHEAKDRERKHGARQRMQHAGNRPTRSWPASAPAVYQ
jgi:hypothetical protein